MVDCLLQAAQILKQAENREHIVPQVKKEPLTRTQNNVYYYAHNMNGMFPTRMHQVQPHHQVPGPAYQQHVQYTIMPSFATNYHKTVSKPMKVYATPKVIRRSQTSQSAQKNPVPQLFHKTQGSRYNLSQSKNQNSSFKRIKSLAALDGHLSDSADETSINSTMRGNVAHNEVEKRRRAFLTSCYHRLHQALPTISGTKASNATVLRTAVEHIKTLETEGKVLELEKKQLLEARNRILQRRKTFKKAQLLSKAQSALAQRRKEVEQGKRIKGSYCNDGVPKMTDYSCETQNDSNSDEEGVVPDSYSRSVSPNLSPRENLTQLGSPIIKKTASGNLSYTAPTTLAL